MGMMKIRRLVQKMLAPVVIVLVVALTVGMFYIAFPRSQRVTGAYKGPSIKIDGKKVSDAQFNEYLGRAAQQANQYAQYGMTFSAAQIRDTALQLAIRDAVIQMEIKKLKLKPKALEAKAEKLIKEHLSTKEELQTYLERQQMANRQELVKSLVKTMQEQKLYFQNAKKAKMKVTKPEVEGYLEKITISHILISLKDLKVQNGKTLRSEAEALRRAEEVSQKIAAKGDFAKLAKEYSDDSDSKDKGGVIGPVLLQQFKVMKEPEFVTAALALKTGEVSKPVKTRDGYYLIRLDKRSLPQGKEYQEQYAEIEEGLLVHKYTQSEAFANWLKKKMTAVDENNMEILDPAIRAYRLTQKEKWVEAAKAYEKALKRKYYKKNWELYLDTAKAYTKAKDYSGARKVLKQVATEYQDLNYQVVLAATYQENKQPKKALAILEAYSAKHPDEKDVHQQLQGLFTEWKMTAAAAKEADLLAKLEQKEAEELKKYQKEMEQKNAQQPQSVTQPQSSQPSPAKAATN
jgi:foldase protein PrsA